MIKGNSISMVVIIALIAIVILIGIILGAQYSRDIQAARERIESLESQSIDTPFGKLQYAESGSGFPALLVHGNAGGFDQGLDLAADSLSGDWRIIAPSRFGYLDSSLPDEATPQMQADAFASLLDALDIEEAVVIAYSAGGPSAVQLALQHPERVSALVMVSTAIADKPVQLPPRAVIKSLFGSDFLTWLMTGHLQPLMRAMFVPGSYELSHEEAGTVNEAMQGMLPAKPRADGIVFDMYVTNADPHVSSEEYPLDEISVPTLIINAKDDPAAKYEDARAMAEQIPGASFISIEQGGHLMLGSGDRLAQEITRFCEQQIEE